MTINNSTNKSNDAVMASSRHAPSVTRRSFVVGSLGAALTMALAACSTSAPASDSSSSGSGSGKSKKPLKMEAILISSASQVTAAQGNHMKKFADSKHIDFSVAYFEQKVATEQSLIENAVQSGVNCLIIQPQAEGDCTDAINAAIDAGVVILLYGTPAKGCKYTLLYKEDSFKAGQKMGTMAAKWAKKNIVDKGGKVVVAFGTYSLSPTLAGARKDGVRDTFLKAIPDAEDCGDYEAAYKEEGLKIGEDILQAHPDCNMFLGCNDQSACGVMEAFDAAGKDADGIGMFGIDGTDEGMYDIVKGTMFRGTVAIPVNEVSEKLIQAGIDIHNGKSKYKIGGKKDIAWESTPIDASNVNDYKDVWGHLAKSN